VEDCLTECHAPPILTYKVSFWQKLFRVMG
jgi:hypothetical protein